MPQISYFLYQKASYSFFYTYLGVSSTTAALRIPQNDFGRRFLVVAVNSQPIIEPQEAQFATDHAYLHQIAS